MARIIIRTLAERDNTTGRNKAQVLVSVLLVLMIASIAVASITSTVSTSLRQSVSNLEYERAYNAAERRLLQYIDSLSDPGKDLDELRNELNLGGGDCSVSTPPGGDQELVCTFSDDVASGGLPAFEEEPRRTIIRVRNSNSVANYPLNKDEYFDIVFNEETAGVFRGTVSVTYPTTDSSSGGTALDVSLIYEANRGGVTEIEEIRHVIDDNRNPDIFPGRIQETGPGVDSPTGGDIFESSLELNVGPTPGSAGTTTAVMDFERMDRINGALRGTDAIINQLRITPISRSDVTDVSIEISDAGGDIPDQVRRIETLSYVEDSGTSAAPVIVSQFPLSPAVPAQLTNALSFETARTPICGDFVREGDEICDLGSPEFGGVNGTAGSYCTDTCCGLVDYIFLIEGTSLASCSLGDDYNPSDLCTSIYNTTLSLVDDVIGSGNPQRNRIAIGAKQGWQLGLMSNYLNDVSTEDSRNDLSSMIYGMLSGGGGITNIVNEKGPGTRVDPGESAWAYYMLFAPLFKDPDNLADYDNWDFMTSTLSRQLDYSLVKSANTNGNEGNYGTSPGQPFLETLYGHGNARTGGGRDFTFPDGVTTRFVGWDGLDPASPNFTASYNFDPTTFTATTNTSIAKGSDLSSYYRQGPSHPQLNSLIHSFDTQIFDDDCDGFDNPRGAGLADGNPNCTRTGIDLEGDVRAVDRFDLSLLDYSGVQALRSGSTPTIDQYLTINDFNNVNDRLWKDDDWPTDLYPEGIGYCLAHGGDNSCEQDWRLDNRLKKFIDQNPRAEGLASRTVIITIDTGSSAQIPQLITRHPSPAEEASGYSYLGSNGVIPYDAPPGSWPSNSAQIGLNFRPPPSDLARFYTASYPTVAPSSRLSDFGFSGGDYTNFPVGVDFNLGLDPADFGVNPLSARFDGIIEGFDHFPAPNRRTASYFWRGPADLSVNNAQNANSDGYWLTDSRGTELPQAPFTYIGAPDLDLINSWNELATPRYNNASSFWITIGPFTSPDFRNRFLFNNPQISDAELQSAFGTLGGSGPRLSPGGPIINRSFYNDKPAYTDHDDATRTYRADGSDWVIPAMVFGEGRYAQFDTVRDDSELDRLNNFLRSDCIVADVCSDERPTDCTDLVTTDFSGF